MINKVFFVYVIMRIFLGMVFLGLSVFLVMVVIVLNFKKEKYKIVVLFNNRDIEVDLFINGLNDSFWFWVVVFKIIKIIVIKIWKVINSVFKEMVKWMLKIFIMVMIIIKLIIYMVFGIFGNREFR